MDKPSKQATKDGLAGLAARSRKRAVPGGGALDLTTTLQKFGYSTGFDTPKYIEEFYSHHPISASVDQREELRVRRDLVSEALKAYVTNHYQSFIETSSEITHIENDMLKLNNLLAQFQVGLKNLSGNIAFSYQDEKLGAKLKAIEKAANGSSGAAEGLLGASSSGQHPVEVELEELNEELRGWIYERKFEKALSTLERATEKARKRAREIKRQREEGGGNGGGDTESGDAAFGGPFDGQSDRQSGGPSSFRAISADLLYLRGTLIEMLFSELRAAATTSSVIGGKAGSGASSSSAHADSAGGVQLQALVGQLISLRQSKKTLQIFLYQVKSQHLRSSIKGIKFTGDILSYIQELSAKFFAGLGATVAEFHRLFQQRQHFERAEAGSGGFVSNPAGLSSYLIRWLLHELLSTYNSIFHRQVFQSEGTFSKLGKCLRHAFHHCQLLETRQAGLNLSFVLSKMFTPSLVDVITKNYKHVESLIHEELNVESWRVTELWVQEKERDKGDAGGAGRRRRAESMAAAPVPTAPKKKRALRLTSSAKYLYDVVRNLLRELVPILDNNTHFPETRIELYPTVIQGMIGLFEGYLLAMAQKLKTGLYEFEEIQSLSIVANSFYLQTDLLPRVIKEMRKQFCGSSVSGVVGVAATIPELEMFNVKLKRLYEALRDSFCSKRATLVWPFDGHLHFLTKLVGGANKYANPMGLVTSGDLVQVTPEWVHFAEVDLPQFRVNVAKCLPPGEVEYCTQKAVGEFIDGLLEGAFKANAVVSKDGSGPVPSPTAASFWTSYLFGLGGLQQFVLDLKYFCVTCGGRLASASRSSGGEITSILPGGVLTEKAALACTSLIQQSVERYCSKTHTTLNSSWTEQTLGWIDAAVHQRTNNPKNNNLAKMCAADKEKDRLERAADSDPSRGAASSSASSDAKSSFQPASAAQVHASSAIALPQRGVRRGSTITPEQLALMSAAHAADVDADNDTVAERDTNKSKSTKSTPPRAAAPSAPQPDSRDRERERARRKAQREAERE